MKQCTQCGLVVPHNMMFYEISDLGDEILSNVELKIKRESNENDCLCESCFNVISDMPNIAQRYVKTEDVFQDPFDGISQDVQGFLDAKDQLNLPTAGEIVSKAEPLVTDFDKCALCLISISHGQIRTHQLPGPVRKELAQRVLPRKITKAHRVCQNCWEILSKPLKNSESLLINEFSTAGTTDASHTNLDMSGPSYKGIDAPEFFIELLSPTTSSHIKLEPSELTDEDDVDKTVDLDKCVWCLTPFNDVRSRPLKEGPEKDLIAARILPREIVSGHRVCRVCWIKVGSALTKKEKKNKRNLKKVLEMSLLERKKKGIVLTDRDIEEDTEESDDGARHAPGEDATWKPSTTSAKKIDDATKNTPKENNNAESCEVIDLPNYRASPNTKHCFVRGCSHRLLRPAPKYLRKVLLENYNLYVSPEAQSCAEHMKEYYRDWSFLKELDYTHKFSGDAIELMLDTLREEEAT